MSDPISPELSIIIVAYNSLNDLKRCLPSIYQNTSQSLKLEVIIVDNYGLDDTAVWLSNVYPSAKVIQNTTNNGYAGGNNLGLTQATGHWTLLLNPDTELMPDCLQQLIETARTYPNALINPKLLNPDGTVNACGNQMHYTGITTCRGLNCPSSAYTLRQDIPLLSGAAILARTQILRDLGGFNESYFMYFEDTDLSLRARLASYELLCEPAAVLTHHYKLGMSPAKFYYLERNRLLTLRRILQPEHYRQLKPALFVTELLMWVFALRGWPYLQARFRVYTYLKQHPANNQPNAQRNPYITDAELLNGYLVALPFDQLVGGLLGRLGNAITRPIYTLLRPRFLTK